MLKKPCIKPFLACLSFERSGLEGKQKCLPPLWNRLYQIIDSHNIKTASQSFCECDAVILYRQSVCINHPFSVIITSLIIPDDFCLSYVPHDVEHCRTLPDNAQYGINHSNNVRLPVASSTSFPAREELIRRRIDDSERLKDSGLMLPYQTVWLSMTVKV